MLLTTEGSADAKTAKTVLAWYERRWTIEEYFRVLKSGTRVEDRRLDHADDLRKCLAFDAITACHVFDLERMARDKPDTPADGVVADDEIVILYVRLMALRQADGTRNPSRTAAARQAPGHPHLGHRHRKARRLHPRTSQPLPGTTLLWKGYVYLRDATHTYRALKELDMIKH